MKRAITPKGGQVQGTRIVVSRPPYRVPTAACAVTGNIRLKDRRTNRTNCFIFLLYHHHVFSWYYLINMSLRIAASMIVFFLMIGAAVWFRGDNVPNSGDLSLVKSESQRKSELFSPQTLPEIDPSLGVSNVDYVSQQLFTDFLNLSLGGQATEEKLTELAYKYAESIASMKNAPEISSSDLVSVSDSKANLNKYTDEFVALYVKNRQKLAALLGSDTTYADLTPELMDLASDVALAYKDGVETLKKMSVPKPLLEEHTNLTNIFLANAWAWESLAKVKEDPVYAYAGIVSTKDNLEKEREIVLKINDIIAGYDI